MKQFISNHKTEGPSSGAFTTLSRRVLREVLILLSFFGLTALMTWPWVTRMRDAVADEGDPYMIAWTLWWNYHQTFTDPLNLFHANVFYPYKYTLAFSEHEYGIALLFFPLFAMGVRALTVQSIATFCGFALSGYGAFRLARTLTGSNGAAWISGIVFAFIPYRFHLMSHLHYLFAVWIPLLLEALVLFARRRTWGRASWLGVAFAMNALTCTSYFIFTVVPLLLSGAFLVLHYRIERDRAFWLRGATAIGVASLALLPFMLPYYFVMKLYGFVRSADDVASNSPTPLAWLVAERRNKLWIGLGSGMGDNARYKLFPGLLPLLLTLPALLTNPKEIPKSDPSLQIRDVPRTSLLSALDAAALGAAVLTLISAGYQGSTAQHFAVEIFKVLTPARALFVLTLLIVIRLSLAYPKAFLWTKEKNLIESVRSPRRSAAVALGLIWAFSGFLGSMGMNFFLNRVLYDFVPVFRAIRIPTHGAMISYVGLALLAGLGTQRLVQRLETSRARARPAAFVLIGLALMFELRAAPLQFVRGKVYPDEITLRLKETPMRAGLVELPHDLGMALPHLYMLRAADHEKPLVNGTSSFVSPLTWEIQVTSQASPIPMRFLDLLETIPASYLVVHTSAIGPERRVDYETFLATAVETGRLRFINRFEGRDDLYAVTKTEPAAKSEAKLPFGPAEPEWAALLEQDPVNLLGRYRNSSQELVRIYVAATGRLPPYGDFMHDVIKIGRGVYREFDQEGNKLESNFLQLVEDWMRRPRFKETYDHLGDQQYVDRLLANAGLDHGVSDRGALIADLSSGAETRAGTLVKVAWNSRFVEKENARSLVLLHYFGFLRRNPDDPPDNSLSGFNFWTRYLEHHREPDKLALAFKDSFEYQDLKKKVPEIRTQKSEIKNHASNVTDQD